MDFEPVRTVTLNRAGITAVAWTPDGRKLLSTGGGCGIRIWDAVTGTLLGSLREQEGDALGLAFANDPNRLWIATFRRIICWDIAKATEAKSFPAEFCKELHVAPGGKRVVWRTTEAEIHVADADSLEVHRVIHVEQDGLNFPGSIGFSPDGTRIVVGNRGHLFVFDLATGERDTHSRLGAPEYEGTLVRFGWLASGDVVVTNREGLIRWGDHREHCRERCWELAVTPDGSRFAVAGTEPVLRILDASGTQLRTLPMGSAHNAALAWSPDGKRLAAGDDSGRLAIWSEGNTSPLDLAGHSQSPEDAVFSPDSRMVAACCNSAKAHRTAFVDIESGRAVEVEGLFGVQPGRSECEFVSVENLDLVFWDGKTGKRIGSPRKGGGAKAYPSPDGTLAWLDGWSVPEDKHFHSFTKHPAPVVKGPCGCSPHAVAWSPDSEFVASSGAIDWHGHRVSLTIVRRDGTVEFRGEFLRPGGTPIWRPDSKNLLWSAGGELLEFDVADLKAPKSSKADWETAGFLDGEHVLGVRTRSDKASELVLVHVPTRLVPRAWALPKHARVTVAPDRMKLMVLSAKGAEILQVVKGNGD